MKKIFNLLAILSIILFSSCNDSFMDRFPETSIGTENFFKSEEDLAMYIFNLYDFPGLGIYGDDAYLTTDNATNTGNTELKTMMISNPSSATITNGWDWEKLRNINLFLENVDRAEVSEDVLNHYIGIARFFRAKFYMEKVKRYSDVPWYDEVIGTDSEEALFKGRDPRTMVIDKIFEDYSFAAQHVKSNQPDGAVDKWVVLAYQARHALYEGTFRKYHPELELESTANTYLEMAESLSKQIMDNGGFSIYNTGNSDTDYASLFISSDLTSNPEVILTTIFDQDVRNSDFWAWYFGDYEVGPARDLLQSYLMADGSYYSNVAEYQTKLFVEEFENRDPRLMQTYAYPGWELINTETYSQGGGIYKQRLQKNFSGYHQIKGFINDKDESVKNSVDVPVLRYAETLLNYAEARAELGQLTQGDLDQTINILRDRAGMPHISMNPAVDPVQEARYPNVSSSQKNIILEIRRERRIELALEGFRHDDLMRYAAGSLLENEPEGLYFPGLGRYDLTGDGVEDIILLDLSQSIPAAEDKEVNSKGETFIYYRVGPQDSDASFYLNNGTSGTVGTVKERGTFVDPKYYYRPIPQTHVTVNPNLTQIMGWD